MNGTELKEAREELGLSQFEMGLMLGFKEGRNTRDQVRRMESGKKEIQGHTIRLIAAYRAGYRPDDWPQSTNNE